MAAESSGTYRLEVQSQEYAGSVGRYGVKFAELRAATERDRTRVAMKTELDGLERQFAELYGAGRYDEALPLTERAVALGEELLGPEHPKVAMSLNNLARLYAAKGETAQAVAALTRAADINERNLTLILTTGSENQKRLYMDTLAGETNFTITLHSRDAPNDPEAVRLALSTVLRRKGRVLDAVQDQVEALRGHLRPPERALLEQLFAARGRLAALVLRERDRADPVQYQAAVAKLETEVERLEAAASAGSAKFRRGRSR